jgi:hypothetical protein
MSRRRSQALDVDVRFRRGVEHVERHFRQRFLMVVVMVVVVIDIFRLRET